MPRIDDPANSEKRDWILELLRSKGWALVEERIKEETERQRCELEEPKDMWETATLRGRIKALRMVLTIPTILKEEFKQEA